MDVDGDNGREQTDSDGSKEEGAGRAAFDVPLEISYSPMGLALALIESGGLVSHMPSGVQALLPDAHGIWHYHRPHMARGAAARGKVLALRSASVHPLLRRMVAQAAEPARIEEEESGEEKGEQDEWESDGDGPPPSARAARDLLLQLRMRAPLRRAAGGVAKVRRGGRLGSSAAVAVARARGDSARQMVAALGQGSADEIVGLLRGGADVRAADAAGRTALHVASAAGNAAGVRVLAHMGGDVDAVDRLGNTPLALAATGARAAVVLALLEAGADPRIGHGVAAALAMVRARLRLLRQQVRQARAVELVAASADVDGALPRARDRRRHAVAVARDCVAIIRLLRAAEARADAPPADLEAPADLDGLADQLLALDIAHGKPSASPPELPPDPAAPADDANADADDRQIDDLLERFSLLLGDRQDAGGPGAP
ncbi:hypothetical protein H4R26_000560 [Coemansia thaxteri]|uniref:Uncharacterized protein n=1 Tax=Coemansia thaxteri TaxID=2663907 RepID=A0A9W8BIG4_9FUNG|nr:hypothetical protein H4R26_000560 [Coemansia thaxteri]KAJ2486365.1 hypothetical protein EV174_001163 [Coemansia sp. RSA 2320]